MKIAIPTHRSSTVQTLLSSYVAKRQLDIAERKAEATVAQAETRRVAPKASNPGADPTPREASSGSAALGGFDMKYALAGGAVVLLILLLIVVRKVG